MAAALILTLLAVWIGWVGYIASDDSFYFAGAERWVDAPPFGGDGHWTTRFPVVLSFALSLKLLGKGFMAFHSTSIGWFILLIALVGMMTARLAGSRAGWIAAALVGTMPTLATFASIVNCDMPELIFILIGAWLLGTGRERGTRHGFFAGISFGLAFLSRETAALPIIGLLPVFLLGRPIKRQTLLWAAAGFVALMGAEALFQWVVSGDPLHRYGLAAHHDKTIDRAANEEGNFLVHPAIDPLLVLLINDDFALLFWIAIIAAAARPWRALKGEAQARLTLIASMALIDFLLVAALVHLLVLNPRYFVLPAMLAVMLVAIWLASLRPRTAAIMLALVVAANLAALSLTNRHPHWASEVAVQTARDAPRQPIIAAPDIAQRAEIPARFAGVHNLLAGPPRPRALYICIECAGVDGRLITDRPPPPTFAGALIAPFGIASHLPSGVETRLMRPGKSAQVWMIGAQPAR
jgi:4-amino-4-deoxy-L-arabinose transferase-like glycosyltransferase